MYISISDIKRDTIFYIIRNLIFYILAFIAMFGFLELEIEIYKKIVVIVILVSLSISCLLYIWKYIAYYIRESYLRQKGIRIEASFNKKEFRIGYNSLIYRYEFVAYYTEDDRMYVFCEDMIYAQPMMALNLEKIKKEGRIPDKITVLVDPDDYNKYIILKYNFINEIFALNQDIVDSYIR